VRQGPILCSENGWKGRCPMQYEGGCDRGRRLPTIHQRVDFLKDTKGFYYIRWNGGPCAGCGLEGGDILKVSRTWPVRSGDVADTEIPNSPVDTVSRYVVRRDGLIELWNHEGAAWVVKPGWCRAYRIVGRVAVPAETQAFLARRGEWKAPFSDRQEMTDILHEGERDALHGAPHVEEQSGDPWTRLRPGRVLHLNHFSGKPGLQMQGARPRKED